MNAETFLEQFDTFADAPNAVDQLRAMILQLAVQGKLVPQDVNDEPASAALVRVKAERELRANAKGIPRQKPSSPITSDEVLFVPPSGWSWGRFGDLCLYIEAGWSPQCIERPKEKDEWGVLKISAVTWGTFNPNENKALPSNLEPRYESEVRVGDFLMTRANTAELVAKSVVVESTPPRLLLNDKTLRVIFSEHVDRHYVNLFNNGTIAREHYLRVASGTSESMRNVSRANIWEMPVPLPPLAARQADRRVARAQLVGATLDRLVSTPWDRLPACLSVTAPRSAGSRAVLPTRQAGSLSHAPHVDRLRTHFDHLFDTPTTIPQLRKTILQLAVQGKLVPQDSGDEPFFAFANRNAGPVGEIAEKEIPFDLPVTWRWSRLGSIAEFINGDRGKNYPNKNEYVPSGIPFINTGHIEPDGSLDLESMHYITRDKFDSLRGGKIQQGDLVYCLRGATLGKTAFVDPFLEGAIASSLVIIRLDESIDRRYIYYFLLSPLGRQLIKRFDNGSAQPNLSSNSVTKYVTPLPPLAEQKRIVAKVTELLSLCDALEAQLKTAESASTELLSAAVHHLLTEEASRQGAKPRRATPL